MHEMSNSRMVSSWLCFEVPKIDWGLQSIGFRISGLRCGCGGGSCKVWLGHIVALLEGYQMQIV